MARRRKGNSVHGWVVLDKPCGLTSTQAVGRVRRIFSARKAGHAGTLDPLATGVLPIALGEATKTVPYLTNTRKSYSFTVKWGEATTTDDGEGAVIATSSVRPDERAVAEALARFVGDISQVPPAFSAVKVDGARAYDLARAGEEVHLEPRTVTVYEARLIEVIDEDRASFEVVCGKGAYVRALARDLARALGTVGHAAGLRRTAVGPFETPHAIPLDKLEELGHSGAASRELKPVETVLDDIPALAVTGLEAQRLRHGQTISLLKGHVEQVREDEVACAMQDSRAVALGEVRAGQFHPTRIFNLPIKGKHDVDYS